MPALVDVEMARLNRRLRKHDLSLSISTTLRDFLSVEGYDKRFGARGLRRAIRRKLEFPLAGFLLDGPAPDAPASGQAMTLVFADHKDGQVQFQYS
jgi:ATP-dependent Clp protease ATP-binding subunit ClpA